MGAKLTANPATRRFVCNGATVNGLYSINAREELYSDMKLDWQTTPTLNVMKFPITPIGGDAVPIGNIGDSYVIRYGWKIQPLEEDHTLRIVGNLFATEDPLVIDTTGLFRVRVQEQVSTLVEVRSDSASAADLARLRKIMSNKLVTNPTTGVMTVYQDDGTTPAEEWDIYEDVAEAQPYRGQGVEVRVPKP